MRRSAVFLGLLLALVSYGCPSPMPVVSDDDATEVDDDDATEVDDDDTTEVDDDDTTEVDDDDATPPPTDIDGDGYSESEGDCDDADPTVHPGVTQDLCNRVDDDCDGEFDEDAAPFTLLPPGVYSLADAHATIEAGAGTPIGASRGFFSAGDTNDDGVDDLLAGQRAATSTDSPGVRIFEGPFCAGESLFSTSDSFSVFTMSDGRPTPIGDLDADGHDDFWLRPGVYLGPHSGYQSSPDLNINVSIFPTAMKAGDLDGDGVPDLAVGSYSANAVEFFQGPVTAQTASLSTVQGDWFFGETLAMLPLATPPMTIVGAPRGDGGRGAVGIIEGLPTADQLAPDRYIDLDPLFEPDEFWIGTGLASDGHDRLCIGPDSGTRVVCGTIPELEAGVPSLVVNNRPGTPDEQVGRRLSMTTELVAVGHPFADVGEAVDVGIVYVRGDAGSWDFEAVEDVYPELGFGGEVALLRDPLQSVTWLAVTNPLKGPGGTIYLFALDVAPTP